MNIRRLCCLLTLLSPTWAEQALVAPEPLAAPDAVQLPELSLPDHTPQPSALNFSTESRQSAEIDIQGAVSLIPGETQRYHVAGPIHLRTNLGDEVFADAAIYHAPTGVYELSGNVSVFSGPIIQRGEHASYNSQTQTLDTSALAASYEPIILESGSFRGERTAQGKMVLTGEHTGVTTHDAAQPNYWIRARKTVLYPGDRIEFVQPRLYIGDTPVFWLPYLSQPLNRELGYRFIPGARSNWGAFLLNSYGVMLGGSEDGPSSVAPWLLSKWQMDVRTRRGLGTGVTLEDTRVGKEWHPSLFRAYYAYDLDPSITRSGIPRDSLSHDRWRLGWQQEGALQWRDPQADYAWHVNLNALSDNNFLEDFDPETYRRDPQPDNLIYFTRRNDDSLFTALARVHLNDFYRTDSRSPELSYDVIRHALTDSRLFHEGQTSFGWYEENIAEPTRRLRLQPLLQLPSNSSNFKRLMTQLGRYEQVLIEQIRALPANSIEAKRLRRQLENPEFARFHTYQELSLPQQYGGWLSLTPHAGVGYSRYFNVGAPAEDMDRSLVTAGVEASVKWSKDYSDWQSPRWGIDGLRHVVQPYTHWSLASTNGSREGIPRIDRLTFSTRPPPIDVGQYSAIDDLDDWNLMRYGVRNQLITRRDEGSFAWLTLDSYLDGYLDDPELDRHFSNFYNDLIWSPLPWLAVDVETQFPLLNAGSRFTEIVTGLKFMPTPDFEFSISNSNLHSHPYLLDSNQINLRAYWRCNEKWGLGVLQQWELDDSTLELEQYTLHRNYDNWVISSGITHRNNRLGEEFGFLLNFTLKDFPSVTLPFSLEAD